MVFEEIDEKLVCRLMQFKIPRNVPKPTVIVNLSETEIEKYEKEREEMNTVNAVRENLDDVLNGLNEIILNEIRIFKPYLTALTLPETHVMYRRNGHDFYFGCTGLATDFENGNELPFRVVGIGNDEAGEPELLGYEFSYPFVCIYG